jgi:hypothetical protein
MGHSVDHLPGHLLTAVQLHHCVHTLIHGSSSGSPRSWGTVLITFLPTCFPLYSSTTRSLSSLCVHTVETKKFRDLVFAKSSGENYDFTTILESFSAKKSRKKKFEILLNVSHFSQILVHLREKLIKICRTFLMRFDRF